MGKYLRLIAHIANPLAVGGQIKTHAIAIKVAPTASCIPENNRSWKARQELLVFIHDFGWLCCLAIEFYWAMTIKAGPSPRPVENLPRLSILNNSNLFYLFFDPRAFHKRDLKPISRHKNFKVMTAGSRPFQNGCLT